MKQHLQATHNIFDLVLIGVVRHRHFGALRGEGVADSIGPTEKLKKERGRKGEQLREQLCREREKESLATTSSLTILMHDGVGDALRIS